MGFGMVLGVVLGVTAGISAGMAVGAVDLLEGLLAVGLVGGSKTVSITWMTPLLAATSTPVTFDLFSMTSFLPTTTLMLLPSTVSTLPDLRLVERTLPETTW